MTTLTQRINDMAETLKDAVASIEATSFPTTKNNYGTYMALMSQFCDDKGQAKILAVALIKAGANKEGVRAALKVSF